MRLSDQQGTAIRSEENTLVVACPGGGKTHTLVAKLLYCMKDVRDTARRIACITYTNVAAFELERRLRAYSGSDVKNYYYISTIHSFCLSNVLSNFGWKLSEFPHGYKIVSPQNKEFAAIVKSVIEDYHLPSKAATQFDRINREPDGTPIFSKYWLQSEEVVRDFWERLRAKGLMDLTNIVFYAYKLLKDNPFVAEAIAAKYAWVLIDEFQDTSALQVEFFKLVASKGRTRFFLVGDPFQSIFSFAGARAELTEEFSEQIQATVVPPLDENYRSSPQIIAVAEKLYRRNIKAGSESKDGLDYPQYYHTSTPAEAIYKYFLPKLEERGIPLGNAVILAPQSATLLLLAEELRHNGIPVTGSAAKPYEGRFPFLQLIEYACAYVSERSPRLLDETEQQLAEIVVEISGTTSISLYQGFELRLITLAFLNELERIFYLGLDAETFVSKSADALIDAFEKIRDFPESYKDSVYDAATIVTAQLNGKNLTAQHLSHFGDFNKHLKLMTLHGSKGCEFDAVAMLELHEGNIPFRYSQTQKDIEESKRLFYVGITRAKHILMLFTHGREQPSRFLGKSGIRMI